MIKALARRISIETLGSHIITVRYILIVLYLSGNVYHIFQVIMQTFAQSNPILIVQKLGFGPNRLKVVTLWSLLT